MFEYVIKLSFSVFIEILSYVDYFADILEGTADLEPRAMMIESIQMRNLPDKVKSAGEPLHIEVYDYTTTASVLPNDDPIWASYSEQNERFVVQRLKLKHLQYVRLTSECVCCFWGATLALIRTKNLPTLQLCA